MKIFQKEESDGNKENFQRSIRMGSSPDLNPYNSLYLV